MLCRMTGTLSPGQTAQRSGFSLDTLRYYERIGLLDHIERTSSGHRRFGEDDLEWLGLCVKLRSSGMPIAAVRRYTELVRAGAGNEAERLVLMRAHQDRLTAQIAETGATPSKAVERLRIEVARQRVQSSSEAIERVAETTGFRDPERMRRAFIRAFGQPPQSLRRAARAG